MSVRLPKMTPTTILVVGGTGSFGRAFVMHVLAHTDDTLVRVFSRDELKQSELRRSAGDERVRYVVGDVRDADRLRRAAQGADVIVHAAAMKQILACEENPFEAVSTNVLGAQHIVDAALDAGVPRVVALSTDKAVDPVSLYGATKLCAERIIVQANAYAIRSRTRLACVRYGNVVGSRGSVVPLFRRQAQEGRLTITDERMTRFWITLRRAVDAVMWAIEHVAGGEIFVPRIPSMRVVDLADAIAPGAAREYIGIRSGEKLHEVLITADESRHTIDTGSVFVVLPELVSWEMPRAWVEGERLPDGFAYTSNTNEWWLSVDELAALLP